MQLKVIDIDPTFQLNNLDNISKAIEYAEDNGANICNLSFTFDYSNKQIVERIKKSQMLFVIAAGNSSPFGLSIDDKMSEISDLDNDIVVANINSKGEIDKNSNYGNQNVHIAAPGSDIYTTCVDGNYKLVTGTSFSCGIVTGVATLIYQNTYDPNTLFVKNLIINTATKLDSLSQKVKSQGYINGGDAISVLKAID